MSIECRRDDPHALDRAVRTLLLYDLALIEAVMYAVPVSSTPMPDVARESAAVAAFKSKSTPLASRTSDSGSGFSASARASASVASALRR